MSTDDSTPNKNSQPSHIAYSAQSGKDDKSHWHRIGAAWPIKNEGLKLQLSSIPLDGVVLLRAREEIERLKNQRTSTTKEPSQQKPTSQPTIKP
jgi:hypothetical protein